MLRKRDPATLCPCCRVAVSVLCLFLAVPWVDLLSVIVAFPDYTHLLLIGLAKLLKLQFLNAGPYAMYFTFSIMAVTQETCTDPESFVRVGPVSTPNNIIFSL